METHSSILAWRIPRTEKTGGLQFTGLQRVGHDSSDLVKWVQGVQSTMLKSKKVLSLDAISISVKQYLPQNQLLQRINK